MKPTTKENKVTIRRGVRLRTSADFRSDDGWYCSVQPDTEYVVFRIDESDSCLMDICLRTVKTTQFFEPILTRITIFHTDNIPWDGEKKGMLWSEPLNVPPIPGVDWELTEFEKQQKRYVENKVKENLVYDGWCNQKTHDLFVVLSNDGDHYKAIEKMVCKNESINPSRLHNYIRKHIPYDLWSYFYPEGYIHHYDFVQNVGIDEIAKEFSRKFKEIKNYNQSK